MESNLRKQPLLGYVGFPADKLGEEQPHTYLGDLLITRCQAKGSQAAEQHLVPLLFREHSGKRLELLLMFPSAMCIWSSCQVWTFGSETRQILDPSVPIEALTPRHAM